MEQVMCRATQNIITRQANLLKCQGSVAISQITINQAAKYTFNIVCPQAIRNNSQVKIKISNDYSYNNKVGSISCWSDKPLNLKVDNC